MIAILTWNIQAGLGVDGAVDLGRIAGVVHEMADPDVVCFQEVARDIPVFGADALGDQVAELRDLFPGYEMFFGPVFDATAGNSLRQRFGNLVMSRIPVQGCRHHLLPRPSAPDVQHMQRQATELLVDAGGESLRVVSTHLEYFVAAQRVAQVERLLELHAEACDNARNPPIVTDFGPYSGAAGTCNAIFCGDFNFRPEDPEYAAMTRRPDGDMPPFLDAWKIANGERPHDPTCGIFDRAQWPGGPHCRDYFFVSEGLDARVEHVEVNTESDASDHQPLAIRIATG